MKGKRVAAIGGDKVRTYGTDPLEKLHKSIGLIMAQIEGLKSGVSYELAELAGLISHAATRVEQLIYALEQDGVITEAKMAHAYCKLEEHKLHLERVLNPSLPMKYKVEEVLKWNEEPTNVKMDMMQIGLQPYLFNNPDKLGDEDRMRLAELGQLTEVERQVLESRIKQEKEQPTMDKDPKVAG